jgi:predicted nucleic acid-binding protein
MTTRLVLDNSVVMAWCFADEASAYADVVLEKVAKTSALVPAIWPLEVINVLLVAERRRRIKPADSFRFLELLSSLPIDVTEEKSFGAARDVMSLARTANLSSYDASYLNLATRHALPIATLDKRLRRAATKLNVRIFEAE